MYSTSRNVIFYLALNALLCLTISNGLEVYIIGGRGDLAKRYLWKGFLELFWKNQDEEMHFYGTGRTELPKGSLDKDLSPFQLTLLECIDCKNDSDCQKNLMEFISRSDYHALNHVKHYEKLCSRMDGAGGEVILYFSVPPSAYERIVEKIADHCDLKINGKKYKFVFEKPFGTDYESALSLSKILERYVDESQVYRVDHYLGKETVHQILNFRRRNPEVESMLNRHFVEYVEVTVTETVGCKERTSYYDKSGVIRDMLHSHLTEVLCLLTMDVYRNNAKLHLLKNISTVDIKDVLLAQYQGYSDEVSNETKKEASWMPTFASARISITGSRWEGVPVWLLSGKMLRERNGYGRIVFKRKLHGTWKTIEGCSDAITQLVFVIRHEKLESPAIIVSRTLPVTPDYIPSSWVETSKFDERVIFGAKGKCFRIYIPSARQDAYSYLIGRLYEGDKESFLPMNILLEYWRIWSPVVKQSDQTRYIRTYHQGSSLADVVRLYDALKDSTKCLKMNIFLGRCGMGCRYD